MRLAHGLGQTDQFVDALALLRERHQHGGDLRVGGLAVEHVAEQLGGLRARQVAARKKCSAA